MSAKLTISEVAEQVLSQNNKLLSLEELHSYIIDNQLYSFKAGADSKLILSKELKKKCINQKYTNKSKVQKFFYDLKINKYGLLSWISKEEEKKYIDIFNKNKILLEKDNNSSKENENVYFEISNNLKLYIKNIFKVVQTRVQKEPFIWLVSLVTLFWIVLIPFFLLLSSKGHELNEIGDYLAGFFSPVLFLWLVYGVFLQKKEFSNMVESLSLQQKEFTDSVETMKHQVVQVEVQHLHTWFNRNMRTYEGLKTMLLKNIKVKGIDSIALISKNLQDDFNSEKDYFNIFDELKNALDLIHYMEEYLNKIKDDRDDFLENAAKELKNEFDIIMYEDIKSIKEIMTFVYILIAVREHTEYKRYSMYQHWIYQNEDIMNLIIEEGANDINSALESLSKKLPSIANDDFLKKVTREKE